MTKTSDKMAVKGEIAIASREYITAHGLAAALGVTARTIARWEAAHILPPKTKIGRRVLFDVAKLAGWLESRESKSVSVTRMSEEG